MGERKGAWGWGLPAPCYRASPEYCISPKGMLTLQDDITGAQSACHPETEMEGDASVFAN